MRLYLDGWGDRSSSGLRCLGETQGSQHVLVARNVVSSLPLKRAQRLFFGKGGRLLRSCPACLPLQHTTNNISFTAPRHQHLPPCMSTKAIVTEHEAFDYQEFHQLSERHDLTEQIEVFLG